MDRRLPLIVAPFLCSLLSWSAISAESASNDPRPELVREVSEGKRSEANASWWGFDPVDSTKSLQAAILSGAKILRIENMGAPWIVNKLQLASDQEIVFEKGAEVRALRGAFKGSGDSLFSASGKQNIALTGHGAILRMWKQDYDDKAQYTHAEWRHVLSFHSCSGVRISGLTLCDSGGDGVYLGVSRKGVPCSDFVIKDVVCANNYRQGISVISARNLLIENCVLKDTWGTAPEAGIDFEPNDPTEELTNCVMRNCVSENNRGDAYDLYLRPLRASSPPVSIRIENCRSRGGRSSVRLVTGNDSDVAGVKGSIEFVNCSFEDSEKTGVQVGDKPLTGAKVTFANCRVIRPGVKEPTAVPILLTSSANGAETMGGIHFESCLVEDPVERQPMAYQDMSGGVGLRDITGKLTVQRGGRSTAYELTPGQVAEWMPHRSFKQIARFETKELRFEPVSPGAKLHANPPSRAKQRGLSEWLLWAAAGDKVTFSVAVRVVGKAEPRPAEVSLISPSGKLTKLQPAEGNQETAYEFTPAETGTHKIVCEPRSFTACVNSSTHPVCLYSESASMHFLGTTGEYFFWVPPGTKEFGIRVSGESEAECVKAALFNAAGTKIEEKDRIAQAHQFLGAPSHPAEGEVWSIRFDKASTGVLEDFHVRMQGIPPVLAHAKERLLKPAK